MEFMAIELLKCVADPTKRKAMVNPHHSTLLSLRK